MKKKPNSSLDDGHRANSVTRILAHGTQARLAATMAKAHPFTHFYRNITTMNGASMSSYSLLSAISPRASCATFASAPWTQI